MIDRLDHLVLTVADPKATAAFYTDVLGMEGVTFGEGRLALKFGEQKINLHQAGREYEPKAAKPSPGSADLCFLSMVPVAVWVDRLSSMEIGVLEGPIERTGAKGPILSIYLRDPDGNLIEIANQFSN